MPLMFQETHERLRLLWSWALLSPILYLFAGRIMMDTGFVDMTVHDLHPYDTQPIRVALALLAVGLAGANVWLRLACRQLGQTMDMRRSQAVQRLTMNFYIMAVLADGLSGLGLTYFMISGHFWGILAGGIASYLSYALAYPQRRDLANLVRLQPGEEEC